MSKTDIDLTVLGSDSKFHVYTYLKLLKKVLITT